MLNEFLAHRTAVASNFVSAPASAPSNVRTASGPGIRTTTVKQQSATPSGRPEIDERSRDVQVMRKRWENASKNGVTVDRNKSIMVKKFF